MKSIHEYLSSGTVFPFGKVPKTDRENLSEGSETLSKIKLK